MEEPPAPAAAASDGGGATPAPLPKHGRSWHSTGFTMGPHRYVYVPGPLKSRTISAVPFPHDCEHAAVVLDHLHGPNWHMDRGSDCSNSVKFAGSV